MKDNKWKLLKQGLKEESIIKFLEEFHYQISSKYFTKEVNNLQNKIKKDLINLLHINLSEYMNEICFNYNNASTNNYFNKKEIEQIFMNENLETFYETQIKDSLCKYAQNQNTIKLEHISVIVAGRTGVGVSTLINSMLKEPKAPEGLGRTVTLETFTYTSKIFTFLNLTDTRGYDLGGYSPKKQKDEIMKNINEKKKENVFGKIKSTRNFLSGKKNNENNKFNDYFHCIWFCVHDICDGEKNALKELKNESNIPVIVVNTRTIIKTEVELMRNKINNLFPDLKFIPILARDFIGFKHFGLDDLLNITIDTIKSMKTNDIFNSVKKEYKSIEEGRIRNIITDIEENIINEIVIKFINNFTYVLNEIEFEQYIFSLFEQLIMGFSFKKEISQNTKELLQKNKIKNFIQSYILFYKKLSLEYFIKEIESKSYEYLDIHVKIEKDKKTSIMPNYKRNKDEFKELIFQYCNDNFCYIAQKYFIYKIIKDIIKPLSESIGETIIDKMNNFLTSNEIIGYYRNIYLKVFSDFEAEINKFRDKNGKIYN